jgi:transcriptional regulator with XRE-family HTH domain
MQKAVMPTKSKKVKKFSINLQQLIKHHAVSIRGMSKATDLDRAHISRLMQGKYSSPGLESLEKIANFFRISIAQLIGEQEINFSKLSKLDFDEE